MGGTPSSGFGSYTLPYLGEGGSPIRIAILLREEPGYG